MKTVFIIFIILILILLSNTIFFFFLNDKHLYIYKEYSESKIEEKDFHDLSARLIATEKSISKSYPKVSFMGSPYDLFISFKTTIKEEDLKIESISLYDKTSKVAFVFKNNFEKSLRLEKNDDGSCNFYFDVPDLNIPYVDLLLDINIRFKKNNTFQNKTINIDLKRNQRIEKRSTIFDALMSV